MRRPSILLCTEGTYPHYLGGVSVWCDQLIRRIPHADFRVLSVVHSPCQQSRFDIPSNVISVTAVPLWGTESPGDLPEPVSITCARRSKTDAAAVESLFVPPFRIALRSILQSGGDPAAFGLALLEIHNYLQSHELHRTFRTAAPWDAFLEELAASERFRAISMSEAAICLGWLVRFFSILAAPLPEVDVAHSSMAGLAGIPCVLLRIRDGIPYVLSEHGILIREVYTAMASSSYPDVCRAFLIAFHRAVGSLNYHFADVITSLGEFNKRWQVRFGADPAKIHYFPNGVDTTRFKPTPALSPVPLVLTLARIYPLKGITTLIEAAAIVKEFVPGVRFRIMGEAADKLYFEECKALVARHGLESTVEFGETSEPAEEYGKAWLYCLPSVSEAMPYVVLEAMLSGCPVAATDVGNVAETLGGCGVLARPNDPADLAAKIVPLLRGPEAAARRRKMAAAGLRRGLASFTLDAATSRFRELYWELLECQPLSQAS